jgi:hypothetical protein
MKINMGVADKLIRIALAFLVAILYYTDIIDGTFALVFAVVAIIFILTSFISFCPLYVPFGINTCAKKTK